MELISMVSWTKIAPWQRDPAREPEKNFPWKVPKNWIPQVELIFGKNSEIP
jgi:hypothetical protein